MRTAGKVLIWIGVLAWIPYVVLKYLAGMHLSVVPFLAVHLLGVIPGSVLSRLGGRRPPPAAVEEGSRGG